MLVTKEYIDQCNQNLKRATSFKRQLGACKLDRASDQGKDNTIKIITKDNTRKDQRIKKLESRWSFGRSFGTGAAVAGCTVFAVSMFGEGDVSTRTASAIACGVGTLFALRWAH